MLKDDCCLSQQIFQEFSNELDKHCLSLTGFFNINLLLLIEKYFGYHKIAIVQYKDNALFDFYGINLIPELCSSYRNTFYKNDEFSAMLTKKYYGTNVEFPSIVKCSDIFGKEYVNSSHYNFFRQGGIGWSAVMLFGNYRITFFKGLDEKDFNDTDMTLMQLVYDMILSRRQLNKTFEKNSVVCHMKNQMLDNMFIGVITLNEENEIIDYNNAAALFLTSYMNNPNIKWAVSKLIALIDEGERLPNSRTNNKCIVYKGYNISLDGFFVKDKNNILLLYRSITIIRPAQNNSIPVYVKNYVALKYGISAMEIKIIEQLIAGKTNQEIADILCISINTVRTHLKNIYNKMELNNQRDLMMLLRNIIYKTQIDLT